MTHQWQLTHLTEACDRVALTYDLAVCPECRDQVVVAQRGAVALALMRRGWNDPTIRRFIPLGKRQLERIRRRARLRKRDVVATLRAADAPGTLTS